MTEPDPTIPTDGDLGDLVIGDDDPILNDGNVTLRPSTELATLPMHRRLALDNEQQQQRVETRIAALVTQRDEINAEVKALRATLVALRAAGRHFAKLDPQQPELSEAAPNES